MKKNSLLFILGFVLVSLLAGCSDDDTSNGETPNNSETIADYIANNAEFTLLNEAIIRVGLDTSLDGTDAFTFFAPNDEAFQNFLEAGEYADLAEVPIETLRQVLLNHLVEGNRGSTNLQGFINTFSESLDRKLTVFASNNGGVILNGNTNVTNADIGRSNGVVHEIDAVLGLLTVSDMTQASFEFSLFEELLEVASVNASDYQAILALEEITYTVLIPSNQAFQEMFSTLGVSGFNDIPSNVLRDMVDYHLVVGENYQSSDLEQGQALPTNAKEDIVVSIDEAVAFVDASGIPASVTTANIQTLNGVIHKLDRVLWSQDVQATLDPTLTRWVAEDPDYSVLETALEVTGLDAVLNDRTTNFTLLAPNNAAFNALLDGEDVDDLPVDELTTLLLNHVILGEVASGELSNGYVNTEATYGTTDHKLSLYVDTTNGVLFNGMSMVSEADITVANGIIHKVDAVITLPTLVTFATADPNLATLTAALTRDDQPDYVSTLSTETGSGDAPFTVWAPDNAAFDALLVELDLGDLSEIDGATLTATLNTHVVAQTNLRAEDLVSGPLSTLGDEITVDADNSTLVDGNGRVSNIQEVNIQAANGVLHVLDTVLLPQ